MTSFAKGSRYARDLREWQRGYLAAALARNGYSVSATSRDLGVNRSHLYRMMDAAGVKVENERRVAYSREGNEEWRRLGT